MGRTEPRLRRQYAKLCDVRDFDDPAIRARIDEVMPGLPPDAQRQRKLWEFALLSLFLEDVGLLHDGSRILSVGAGHETVLFWLANRAGEVVATDIYGKGEFIEDEADPTMLTDPAAFAPYPYREDRLKVRWMDARALDFANDSFDAVFTLSSIEHFGTHDDVARAATEIGRVVRPGGYAFIVTECYVRRHVLNSPWVQTGLRVATAGRLFPTSTPRRRAIPVFTPRELQQLIVVPSGLSALQPLDFDLSAETWTNITRWTAEGALEPATGAEYPHILLQHHAAPWTSVAIALRKVRGRSTKTPVGKRVLGKRPCWNRARSVPQRANCALEARRLATNSAA